MRGPALLLVGYEPTPWGSRDYFRL